MYGSSTVLNSTNTVGRVDSREHVQTKASQVIAVIMPQFVVYDTA